MASLRTAVLASLLFTASALMTRGADTPSKVDVFALREQVLSSPVVQEKIAKTCARKKMPQCESKAGDSLFCELLGRSYPDLAASHCASAKAKAAAAFLQVDAEATPSAELDIFALRDQVLSSPVVQEKIAKTCEKHQKMPQCEAKAKDSLFCELLGRSHPDLAASHCSGAKKAGPTFLQVAAKNKAPEDDLAKEMTHDLEMNFNKIAPFGKEDTAKELQDHAAKTQDTLVDAVENAEVAEIKRAVFRALTRLRAATIKEFDTIARLETQAIDAYNDAHHYRAENPLAHLHEDEAPVETDKLKSFH